MGKKLEKQSRIKLEHIEPQVQPSSAHPLPQQKAPKLQLKQQTSLKRQENVQSDKKSQSNIQAMKKTKKIKHARLIIRNLVFDINEKHIKKLMAPFGEVQEISIPRHPDKNTTRGFAFVEMSNKIQCLKAIKKLNGTQFKGRPIVLDLAVSKQNFMTEKLKDPKQNAEPKEEKTQKEQQMQDEQDQQKVKKEEVEQKSEDEEQQNQQNSDQESEQESEGQKLEKQKEDHKYEIFIRNLPISTTEDDLYKHFVKHGRIKFVRVCKNKQTGVSKGTAFIKFYDAEVPEKLIHYSRSYEMFLLKKLLNFVPDPNYKLEIDGIIMKIFPVQSRKQIEGKLKDRQGENKTEKKLKPIKKIKKLQDLVKIDTYDKRKLSLALLGRWKAHENMNENDYALLKSHEREKIAKLKNPNASVSATRIIIKHLEKTITEQEIRNICLKFLSDRDLNKSALTYCKLMLEKDMKKSAGFAFVQFKKHETAKQFLQMLVKSPQTIQKRLYIVEFAIQDSRKMLKLAKRNNQAKQGPKPKKGAEKEKKQRADRTPGKKGSNIKKPRNFKKKFIKK